MGDEGANESSLGIIHHAQDLERRCQPYNDVLASFAWRRYARSHNPPPTLAQMRGSTLASGLLDRTSTVGIGHQLYLRHPVGCGTSSDLLRQSAPCTWCGGRGADLQHRSSRSRDTALAYYARAEVRIRISRKACQPLAQFFAYESSR